jgi:hypothetical protein
MTDLFSTPRPANIGHGNAQFLADLQEPGITINELRARTKQGKYPDLYKGAKGWILLGGIG